jgi:WD40 repeat protein
VYLYHLTSGKQLHSFNASEVPVCAVAFTDDGKFLACGSADGSSAVYDIAR